MHKLLTLAATIVLVASAEASVAEDVGAGKTLYESNCLACHGTEGQGGAGKKLAGDSAYWDFPIFKRAVMEGIDDKDRQMKGMPVFEKTGFFNPKGSIPTDAELQDIQAYLKTLAPAG